MNELKAKKRYEITKEKRNFDVKRIEPKEYDEELYNIQIEAFRKGRWKIGGVCISTLI